jgi:hypothetical protein
MRVSLCVIVVIKVRNMSERNRECEIALLRVISDYMLDEDCPLSSGEIRQMLYDAIDLLK